jgi:hypothetical protein
MSRIYNGTFIGGPMVGQRAASESPRWQCTEYETLGAVDERLTPVRDTVRVHVYQHREIYTDDRRDQPVGIWLYEDLTMIEALSLMLRAYERTGG